MAPQGVPLWIKALELAPYPPEGSAPPGEGADPPPRPPGIRRLGKTPRPPGEGALFFHKRPNFAVFES